MKLVLDTSVFVAGLRSRTGASFALLGAARHRKFLALISVAIFLEYEDVLKRPEHRLVHGLSLSEVDAYLRAVAIFAAPVERRYIWRPQLADPSDEAVLEVAVNGRANAIVTHNVRDFGAAERFGVGVWTPGHALKRISP